MIIDGKNGYPISYEEQIPDNAKTIIIAMHGFCGDKESGCISLLEQEATKFGIGLVKFDWPAHGESNANGEKLRIDNCLSDLQSVIDFVKANHPQAKLVAFSTSFGGYLTLLYNKKHENVFDYIILRSPAIKMYDVLTSTIMNEVLKEELAKKQCFDYGFERIITITNDFVNDLKENDIVKIYDDVMLNNVSIIHGTVDDLVPFSDSKEFSDEHGCNLYPIEGADHRYKKPGELEKVISISINILKGLE